jgi:hypothetical protein
MSKQDLLTKLFSWSAELTIKDQNDQEVMKVYQRVVGDYDLQTARKAALRYTNQLRRKVSDEKSDDYQVYVAPVLVLSREEQETLALYDSILEVQKEAEKLTKIPEPKEPEGDAPTVEYEKYVELDDTYEERYMKLLNENTQKLLDKKKEELKGLSEQELKDIVIQTRIESLCESELKSKFFEHCVYLGTYEDKAFKTRLYYNFDDFGNIPEFLKMQLMKGYADLEMTAISLKESRRTEPSVQV